MRKGEFYLNFEFTTDFRSLYEMDKVYFSLVILFIFGRTGNCDQTQYNVNNQPLTVCSTNPMTGWYRNGKCMTDVNDWGTHVVCAVMTDEFLDYTKSRGNDLSTRRGSFPGLKVGDRWCLCSLRWKEAHDAGKAPLVDMSATNKKVLNDVEKDILKLYAVSSKKVEL